MMFYYDVHRMWSLSLLSSPLSPLPLFIFVFIFYIYIYFYFSGRNSWECLAFSAKKVIVVGEWSCTVSVYVCVLVYQVICMLWL